jgi:hypothetical protein
MRDFIDAYQTGGTFTFEENGRKMCGVHVVDIDARIGKLPS